MTTKEEILAWLSESGIPYALHQHDMVHTMEDCLQLPFVTDEMVFCKNVFLCNRQKTQFYLMLLRPHTAFRTAVVSKALGVSRLSFAPDDALETLLHLQSGAVSPLALHYDEEHQITLCYEKGLEDASMLVFHPCDSTASLVLEREVFWKRLLPLMKVRPVAVDCAAENG